MSSNQDDNSRTCEETLCCVSIKSRYDLAEWMLLDDGTNHKPSILQRILCQCSPQARVESGIAKVPEIAGLAGATLQRYDSGSPSPVMTMKWAAFNPKRKEIILEPFGGCCGNSNHAQWAEPAVPSWICLQNMARLCDYTYRIKFDEDWRRADIDIIVGCCCFCPAWFTVPGALLRFEMVQVEDSTDGTHWIRKSAAFGGDLVKSYELVEVFKADGSPGRFVEELAKHAPERMVITR